MQYSDSDKEDDELTDYSIECKTAVLNRRKNVQKYQDVLNWMDAVLKKYKVPMISLHIQTMTRDSLVLVYVLKSAQYFEYFYLLSHVEIHLDGMNPKKLKFITYITKNDWQPLCVKDQMTRFMISKHFLKLNGIMKFGMFSVDNLGVISFQLMGAYEANGPDIFTDADNIERWFKVNYATTITTLKGNMTRILKIADILDDSRHARAQQILEAEKGRSLNPAYRDHQQTILKRFEYFLEYGQADFKPEDLIPKYDLPFYQEVEVLESGFQFEGKLASGGYADIYICNAMMKEGEKRTQKYAVAKVPKKDSKAHLRNPEQAKSSTANMSDEVYLRTLAFGEEKQIKSLNIDCQRIDNERKILRRPDIRKFPFIARYYDDRVHPILYLEHYMPHNLWQFVSKKFASLQTLLFWFYQIAQFLSFTKKYKIVHLDLKPENIVIAKNYYLKVIDFAESIIINDPNHIYMQRGHTMPYTAPDILKAQHILAVGTESDVFSFAHIIYTVLTRKRLTGHKRTSNNKLSHKYKNDTFKSAPLPDELKYMGPKYLMKYIYPTIMMCFASNPSSRLPPEQAVSIFYELMTLSEKMFQGNGKTSFLLLFFQFHSILFLFYKSFLFIPRQNTRNYCRIQSIQVDNILVHFREQVQKYYEVEPATPNIAKNRRPAEYERHICERFRGPFQDQPHDLINQPKILHISWQRVRFSLQLFANWTDFLGRCASQDS